MTRYAPTFAHHFGALLLAALFLLAFAGRAQAAPPPAGSVIGNQATATYQDATGTSRTSTSNLVQTTVTQIYSHTLTASQSKQVAAGNTVYYAHTLVNTGNGTDSYTLSAVDATAAVPTLGVNPAIYADANGDGLPDNNVDLRNVVNGTGPIASGANFRFVVAQVIPASQASGATDTIFIGAVGNAGDPGNYTATTGTAPAGAQVGNTDTWTVAANAVINVTKSFSVQSGGASGAACVTPFNDPSCRMVRVTLTYTNSGQATATNVTLSDVIGAVGPTANLTYVPDTNGTPANRPLWSGSATTLTDAAAGDPAGIVYDFGVTLANVVTATIGSVAPGQSGTVSFSVIVKPATPAGDPVNVAFTANTARFCYNDGAAQFPAGSNAANCSTNGVPTNMAAYTVTTTLTGNVIANNDGSANDGGAFNLVTIATANQGTSVDFVNFVRNSGNVTDRFNMTIDALNAYVWPGAGDTTPGGVFNNFPAGTTFQLFSASGGVPIAPLTDTNGDGVPDTGPVAAGASVQIVLRVNLPPNALIGAAPGYSVIAIATSVASGVANAVADRLTTIDNREIDLANGVTAGTYATRIGTTFNLDATGAAVSNVAVTAGGTANFLLWVTNNGPGADNFDLIVRNTNVAINSTGVSTNSLPAGWTARFVSTGVSAGGASCPASGQVVTNTGSIIATGACEFRAEITVPITQAGGVTTVYFRAASPVSAVYGAAQATSASYDTKVDTITVTAVGGVTLQPNRSGQVFPGGNIVYTHQLCNTGSTPLAANSVTVSHANNGTAAGWTNAVYVDSVLTSNPAAGTITIGTDTQIAAGGTLVSLALNAGECVFVFDNVFSPAGATAGATDVVTITANGGAAGTGVVTDTTSVITGDLSLTKEQAAVPCAAGPTVAGGVAAYNALGWVSTNLAAQAPGSCVAYRITATNTGATDVTNLIVSDAVPQYTKQLNAACEPAKLIAGVLSPATAPGNGLQGQVSTGAAIGTVAPLALVRLYYCVQLDQ